MIDRLSKYNYLNHIAENVKLEINKTNVDVKCYNAQILLIRPKHGQIVFTLTKNNKKYKDLETVYFNCDAVLAVKIITGNILTNMRCYNEN